MSMPPPALSSPGPTTAAALHEFINARGEVLTLNQRYYILETQGFGEPTTAREVSRYPGQIGATHQGFDTGQREFSLSLRMRTDTATDTLAERSYMLAVLNQRLGAGRYRVTYQGGRQYELKQVYCEDGLSFTAEGYPSRLPVQLHFRADDPYWYQPIEDSRAVSLDQPGGIQFPLTFPMYISPSGIYSTLNINTAGTARTWPRIEVLGPAGNVTVENLTTSMKLKVNYNLGSGERLVIDMNPTVRALSGILLVSGGITTNLISKRSADSRFWALEPGDNNVRLGLSASAGTTATIYWSDRFIGI